MTSELVGLGWRYPAETAAEKLILLKICDESNSKGQSIYFSMKSYARAGMLKSTRGAQKIIRRLEEKHVLLEDPEFEATLRKDGKLIRARVYRLNIEKMKADIEAAKLNPVVIDAWEEQAGEPELSSPSGGSAGVNSVPVKGELSSPNTYLESFTDNPHNPLEQDFTEDFEKLWSAWKPFEMLNGDRPQAERKYAKIRGEGVSAKSVMLAARVYCQQCRNTRCKTKHLENWLGQCVWKPEEKTLGEGSNGKSRDKKPAVAEADGRRALKHQPWHDHVREVWGEEVYRSWISPLWLEGDIVYCPGSYTAQWVSEHYGRVITEAVGHAVRYVAESPPQHAFADFIEQSAGEDHGQDQVTA